MDSPKPRLIYRCVFHMSACPGGCGDRGWCWAEGTDEADLNESQRLLREMLLNQGDE